MKTMSSERIRFYKENFPKGIRVQLDRMGDDPNPIPKGTKGTVMAVDDGGTVFWNFDNERCLGICPEVDSFHKISEQEENLEPTMSMWTAKNGKDVIIAIKFFDMFSGIGGFRSGLEQAGGFECVGFCEIDCHAAAAYRAMYETRKEAYYSDIARIDTGEMPDFDLLVGGLPCQPYPEKKNIPKNRKKAHSKGKMSRKIRDKNLQTIWYNYYAGIAWLK